MGKKSPQEQTREIIDRFVDKTDPNHRPDPVLSRIMGLTPAKEPPPDDMPALEKIKVYARSGYHLHHIGTDEDFERVWAERSLPLKSSTRKKLPAGIFTSNRAIIVPRGKGVTWEFVR